jgi:hypothetical protein
MNFSISKLSSLLHESLNVFSIQHIARNSNSASSIIVNTVCYRLCFRCCAVSTETSIGAGRC